MTVPATKTSQRIAELEQLNEAIRRDRDEMKADRDRWRDAKMTDPEVECLAGCVRAIEAMREAEKRASPNRFSSYSDSIGPWTSAYALDNAIGRVLMAVAARYRVNIEAPKPVQLSIDDSP